MLEEDIYVEQPKGFQISGNENKGYKLHKALYGLKQAPRAWYNRIDDYLRSLGFNRIMNEHTLYVKLDGCNMLIVSLYVDDLLVTGINSALVENFKEEIQKVFEMTDLGEITFFFLLWRLTKLKKVSSFVKENMQLKF